MFGADLVRAFGEFKAIWDPGNAMNPHKVVDPYCPARISGWARTITRRSSRRISGFPTTRAASPTRRSAASASANAARKRTGPCAPATW